MHPHRACARIRIRNRLGRPLICLLDGLCLGRYQSGEFQQAQAASGAKSKDKLLKLHHNIVDLMKVTHKVFRSDGPEVQHCWARYTLKMDHMVEMSLKLCVKRGLVALAHVITGDAKVGQVYPAFKINVVLDADAVNLMPLFVDLRRDLKDLGDSLSAIALGLERLPQLLARNVKRKASYREVIDADDEGVKLKAAIYDGVMNAQPKIEKYLQTWVTEYAHIWLVKKDPFIKRYANSNPPPPLYKFDADISRYDEIANNTERHDSQVSIDFLQLDNSPIKFSITEHCSLWRTKFTSLLYEQALGEMSRLRASLADTTERLAQVPETLDQMCETIELMDKTKDEMDETAGRFKPISDMFDILIKHEVEVEEDHLAELDGMPAEWETFVAFLETRTEGLEESRRQFKAGLLKDTEDLTKSVVEMRAGFLDKGPFSGEVAPGEATAALASYHQSLAELRATEAGLAVGLKVFAIAQAPYKEFVGMDADLGFLDQLWGLASEFDAKYAEWKVTTFNGIETEVLENEAGSRLKKLVKLQRQVKDKEWDMVQHYRDKLSTFKAVMPLILDLKEPAMRDRHWKRLMEQVGKDFDPYSEEFTLGSMIDLELAAFSEQVSDISGAAAQELKIEHKIAEIAAMWEQSPTSDLLVGEYKPGSGHYLLQGTDDLFAALEDNQVTLGTMKASRFVKVFAKDVDKWERALSLILEVIEMTLTVQRQWMYLENIFTGEGQCKSKRTMQRRWGNCPGFVSSSTRAHIGGASYVRISTSKRNRTKRPLRYLIDTDRRLFVGFI